MTTHLDDAPGALTGTWTVDPVASQITIAVRYALVGTIRARFTDLEGALFLHPDIGRCSAMLVVHAASVRTGPPVQDQWLRSAAFLDTDTYRYIWFQSTEVTPHPSGRGDQALVTGELAIRDVARPVQCAVHLRSPSVDSGSARAKVTGQVRLSRAEFGLGTGHDIRGGGVLLGDQLTVDLDIRAVRQLAARKALTNPATTTTNPAASPTNHNPHGDGS